MSMLRRPPRPKPLCHSAPRAVLTAGMIAALIATGGGAVATAQPSTTPTAPSAAPQIQQQAPAPVDPCATTTTPTSTTTTPPTTTTATTTPAACTTVPAAPSSTTATTAPAAPAAPATTQGTAPNTTAPTATAASEPELAPAQLPADPAPVEPVAPTDPELSSKTAEPDPDYAPTEDPNATVVPGQMRSDREEIPAPFTKEDADKAETMEARQRMSRAAVGCQTYWPSPYEVCGAIRDKYNSLGGPGSFLSYPYSPEYTSNDGIGKRTLFLNGPIYWSPAGGAHPVVNSFLNRWGVHQYEEGFLKYPTTDEIVLPDGGRRQEFQQGAIYVAFQNAIGSAIANGPLRDKYNSVGGLAPGGTLLGYLTEDHKRSLPDGQGQMARFQNGVIYYHPTYGANVVRGEILTQWSAEGYEGGPAGYPVEDQRQISATGVEQAFQNSMHAWPRRSSETYCGFVCTDAIYESFPELRGISNLISQLGAPMCNALPAPVSEQETFYACFDPTPAIPNSNRSTETQRAPQIAGVQPAGSILPSKCYNGPSAEWYVERHYACVYISDLNGHGVAGDRGQNGGQMNYEDMEISMTRADEHGRKLDIEFRAVPRLTGIAAKSILEVTPKCSSSPGNTCQFSPTKGYTNIYDSEPVQFSWTTTFDAPAVDQLSVPDVRFEMNHVSTGGTPVDTYKPAALPYNIGHAPVIRCDNYASLSSSDCIFSEATPALEYGPSANVPEVSWPINKAQLSGLPGADKSAPLHRATADQLTATRSIACKRDNSYPSRPTGKQCDEYPFAAAREGAQLSGVGTERTYHPQCTMKKEINGVPTTFFPEGVPGSGPSGFSVCMVNADQNMSAGRAIANFHRRFRVDIGQEYIVKTYEGTAPVEGPR